MFLLRLPQLSRRKIRYKKKHFHAKSMFFVKFLQKINVLRVIVMTYMRRAYQLVVSDTLSIAVYLNY